MKKQILSTLFLMGMSLGLHAQTWIWYPGDYEVWLGNEMNNRRTERGTFFPPFWKSDSHFVTVEFSKKLDLAQGETINIMAEGRYNVKLDGKMIFGMPKTLHIPAGKHNLNIKVWNQQTPPAIFVSGKTIKSDATWQVTNEDKEWIDESGKASDTSASVYMDAGTWNFNTADMKPSEFRLKREPMRSATAAKTAEGGMLYDFGRETFGYLVFEHLEGAGRLLVYYGESAEEAQDKQHCETLDAFDFSNGKVADLSTNTVYFIDNNEGGVSFTTPNSKAYRYVYIETEGGVAFRDLSMQYEYLPVDIRGTFRCDDEMVNKMWDIGIYTLHLTTREFFIDGIKRDRWTWSGDAYQSYLMNYYSFFDSNSVKRTTWQLRGKDPVTSHINTIMDYTFYWFMGIYDYYLYTGDDHFVKQIYPRMQSLMDYVLGRTNEAGMVEGLTGDWVFVDWSPKPMPKKGALSFEQILFVRSLETMAACAGIVGNADEADKYKKLAANLRAKLLPTFWDEQTKALVHHIEDGKQNKLVTKYANMFGILYNELDEQQKKDVIKSVIHNPNIMPITTPYMRFYEMEALCAIGEQADVMKQMKDYWGGMMRHGATTFWEAYDPSLDPPAKKGKTRELKPHLNMYGRPYGKSLCHAWGASPVYLLGKYFLGVKPTKPGYAEYSVTPVLGGLKWMEGDVPTPNGKVHVYMDRKQVRVHSSEGEGWLHLPGKTAIKIPANQEVVVKL